MSRKALNEHTICASGVYFITMIVNYVQCTSMDWSTATPSLHLQLSTDDDDDDDDDGDDDDCQSVNL